MKKLKTSVLAFFCAAALLLGLAGPEARAAGDVVLLAINDQMVTPISASTMPIYYNYSYYVPYVIFDRNYMRTNASIQTDLGIVVGANSNKVTLYNRRRNLVYDLDAGTCVGNDGNNYPRAIVRGGMTYVPLSSVQQFFAEDGLSTYQRNLAEYGTLIRLTTPSVILNNEDFVDAAMMGIPNLLRDYYRSQNPSPSPSPSPSQTVSPSPSPSPTVGEKPNKSGVRTYLAFQCGEGDSLPTLLDTLDRNRISALFLFRPEDLAKNEALVRRVIGSGHAIGLTVAGGPAEDASAQLEEGNRVLELIAHTSTRTVTLENGDAATTAALQAKGWSVWRGNVPTNRGSSTSAYVSTLMNAVDSKKNTARITLNDDARSANALQPLIRALTEQRYNLRLAVGGELS